MKVELISWTNDPVGTVAKAASACYDSTPDRKIVNQCINSGHCYDKNTQVLTDRGFMDWSKVDYETNLAVIDPKNRAFKGFEKPTALIQYRYKGQMIHFNTKDVDLMITPEHKLYCSLSSTAYKRTHPEFELIPANKIVGKQNAYKNPVYKKPLRLALTAVNTDTSIGDYIYKLYGFFIGDGYSTGDGNFIQFHIKKDRKIQYLKQICEECGLKIEEKSNNKYNVYTDPKIFKELFYNENREKTFPISFLTMSKESFEYFFEGLINSDGNVYATGLRYDTTSVELKERLSALFSINNINHTITYRKSTEENWKDIYTFNISNNKNKYPMFNDSRQKNAPIEVDYNDMVYCAEVSTGLLIVRRNDKVCLCGNCSVIEHMNFTFKIEGVSRALTHQLVRHRIASYSQRSQRYCSEEETKMVVPPSIEQNSVAIDIYNKIMWRIEEAYQDLQALEIPNEDARFVLPNACETTIYMTMNLRTLAHFMNERLCTRAQWEIRKMAQEMKKAIKEKQFEMQLDDLDTELIMSVCVPKCEAGKIKFCPEHKSCGRYDAAKKINDFLNNYPVKELKGKWIFDDDTCLCSVCGTTYDFLFNGSNYCPNCGTKMTMEVHE